MNGAIVSAREAAGALPKLLTRIEDEGTYYITDGRGRARAVLLDVDRYHAMMDALEDQPAKRRGGQSSPGSVSPDAVLAGALIKQILARAKR